MKKLLHKFITYFKWFHIKFRGKKISKIKRIVIKILGKLGLIKKEKVYTKTNNYFKQLKQFSKKKLIQKLMFIRAQALSLPEITSRREWGNLRTLPKRKLISLIIQFTYQLQRR